MSTHSKYKLMSHVMYNFEGAPKLGSISEVVTAVSKDGVLVKYTMANGDEVIESQVTGEVSIKKPRPSRSRKAVQDLKELANGATETAAAN